DHPANNPLPPPAQRGGAFELRLRSSDFRQHRDEACQLIRQLLDDNPHSTLRIVLEPTGDPSVLTMSFLQAVRTACLKEPSYLDRFYSMQLGRPKGAKHIVIRLPWSARDQAGLDWIDDVGQFASIVWTGEDAPAEADVAEELEAHEFVLA
ncbi:MAG: Radical SAM domain protein, partial [Planctomycetota bacterium]